jgi:hypothetical protein
VNAGDGKRLSKTLAWLTTYSHDDVWNLQSAKHFSRLITNSRIARYIGPRHGDDFREVRPVSEGSLLQELLFSIQYNEDA